MATAGQSEPRLFSTAEYRILSIDLVDGAGQATTIFRLGQQASRESTIFEFGKSFGLRVDYECLLPDPPVLSCGVAAAFTRMGDMEPIMYFNTNYPHSDEEIQHYDDVEFRQYIGRRGSAEAYIPRIQLRPGTYLLTVGILPNQPTHHEFYELHYLQYPITVKGQDIPAIFLPQVTFTHSPSEGDTALTNTEVAHTPISHSRFTTEIITPLMLQTGITALRKYVSSLSSEPREVVTEIYLAMRRSAGANGC
jgi:hypothetical protein